MKSMQLAEDVLALAEFKARASEIVRKVRERGRPVLITQNGKPAAVLISPADFDRLAERERFVSAVEEGIADSEAGRVVADEDLGRELDRRFGKLPKR
jgi:prevent-host-death family protein